MNMHVLNDKNFNEFLFRVGNGEEPTDSDNHIQILESMIVK